MQMNYIISKLIKILQYLTKIQIFAIRHHGSHLKFISNKVLVNFLNLMTISLPGLVIYFSYGIHHSKENSQSESLEMSRSTTALLQPVGDGEDSDEI